MKCYPHARDIYTIIFAGWFNKANCKCDIGIKKNLIKISKNTELYYQPFFFSIDFRLKSNLCKSRRSAELFSSPNERNRSLQDPLSSVTITKSRQIAPNYWLVDVHSPERNVLAGRSGLLKSVARKFLPFFRSLPTFQPARER